VPAGLVAQCLTMQRYDALSDTEPRRLWQSTSSQHNDAALVGF